MPKAMPTAELLFREEDATAISTDEATVKPWSHARACLESAPKIWLYTVRPDGRPHVMPVLLVWVDDAPRFTTRPTSRKGRNLARNSQCVLTVASEDLDLVVRAAPPARRVRPSSFASRPPSNPSTNGSSRYATGWSTTTAFRVRPSTPSTRLRPSARSATAQTA
jgi:pyridoxine/pyridoxamine 5'-phosphate oxidase